jgi:hypothetical protein
MRITIVAMQTAFAAVVAFIAVVALARFLDWLFGGNVVLWVALPVVGVVVFLLVVVIDWLTEQPQ